MPSLRPRPVVSALLAPVLLATLLPIPPGRAAAQDGRSRSVVPDCAAPAGGCPPEGSRAAAARPLESPALLPLAPGRSPAVAL
ncbi:MAG TPA: hypothetical protein VNM66_00195, partial [Thermodesulfobacteriota bacterium]|nr:hypothetical protein [Thermodesulfobacteriota bacterium]